MREIGVRELKSALSATLRTVARGERVRVTVHGRPVADIVPPGSDGQDDVLRRLVTAGRLTGPLGPMPSDAPDLIPARRSASALVLDERAAER